MSKLITKARAGVTLVELLVVILIVTILSVSLLPLLKPYIVKAQYAAEPIPVIGNLRTQIGMYQYERNYLPGMIVNAQGVVDTSLNYEGQAPDENFPKGGCSNIDKSKTALGVQTFVPVVTNNLTKYLCALGGYEGGTNHWYDSKGSLWESGYTGQWFAHVNHFANHIKINYEDLTGKRMKPNHIQYRVLSGGYQSGNYAYVIGVFGDANGLASGTGYAVIEIVNTVHQVKYVGTWERYKPVTGDATQITLRTYTESGTDADQGLAAKDMNLCWLGNPAAYLTTDASKGEDVEKAIGYLRDAGWEF